MLVKSFLAWMDKAPVRERAEAVMMLARAYLSKALGGDSPEAVEAALSFILDDPSPMVRRALAMAFADRMDAPRHIVLSLSADQPEVSGLLIARSPLLTEADLVDLAVTGERLSLMAIALRPDTSRRVAHAIVARGDFDSAFALVGNGNSDIAEPDFHRMVEIFGDYPRLREAMLARDDLPASVRHALMLQVAKGLDGFVTEGGFLNPARKARILDDTLQSGTVTLARKTGKALPAFVAHLREAGHLTPALLLRSVLGGDTSFLAAALADLCEMDRGKVSGILASRSDAAIVALIRRAGIPAFLERVLTAAVRTAATLSPAQKTGEFSLSVIRAAQSACPGLQGEDGMRLIALLRRYEAEAARSDSRRLAESLRREVSKEQAQLSLLPSDIGPELLRLSDPGEEVATEVTELREAAPAPVDPASIEPATMAHARKGRRRGLVLDEPIPDLKTLIDEWKAERVARDRSNETLTAALAGSWPGNQNDRRDRSRVA